MTDPTIIKISLDTLARQLLAREALDKTPEFDNAENIEYSIRISKGKLIAEFTPVGVKSKRQIR